MLRPFTRQLDPFIYDRLGKYARANGFAVTARGKLDKPVFSLLFAAGEYIQERMPKIVSWSLCLMPEHAFVVDLGGSIGQTEAWYDL